MKKLTILIFLVLITTYSFGQKKITGIYENHFGETIELESGYTFFYSNKFDLNSGWTAGKWKVSNDTIYFEISIDIDALRKAHSSSSIYKTKDTLVISLEQKLKQKENLEKKFRTPEKLFFKNNKLYLIMPNGKIDNRKVKLKATRKKYKKNFTKTE
jgi:hypothetical protein